MINPLPYGPAHKFPSPVLPLTRVLRFVPEPAIPCILLDIRDIHILPLLYHRNYGHCFNICLRFLKEKRQKSGGMVSAPSAITCARCINHPYSLEIMPNASAMSRLQPSTLTVSSPKMPNVLPVVFLSMMEFSSSSVRPEASMTAPTCTLAP